ncbi:Uncharacterised protein [Candidatus Bilamarchaeum dharawalense]|uniref:Membrane protein 6-pyruvoyl-tetrahydropterin synthase-related domain-containing protein n=1 Tax=Candidatus Bilamarchaeum dharawalense TaxID=2885759 RepID=A0A5E4LN29_9ARCH|nr:Uncharacterised protein [Candidatus Bilamarchaeum dharawalense]
MRLDWKEVVWAVLPGIIACFAILYPFFLSPGEFVYLDWRGTYVSLWPLEHFSDVFGQSWLTFRNIPFFLLQIPFILLFGYSASAIFSKVFFLAMFAGASAGLYLFFKEDKLKYLLAVAILCFSPFVYERIMMGQFGVVYNILMAPLFLYFTKKYFDDPNRNSAFLAAFFLTLSTLVQTHGILLHFILFGVISLFYLSNKKHQRPVLATIPYFALFYLLLNLYWIIPLIVLPQAPIFSSIDSSDMNFFEPRDSVSSNIFLKTAAQFGSWREAGLSLSFDLIPRAIFLLALIIFIYISAIGVIEEKSQFNYGLAISAIVGFLFALGSIFPLFDFAVSFVPMFSGFRDSNKFVELVTLFYAFLLPVGLSHIVKKQKKLIFSLFIIGAIAYNYPAIGLYNQLHPISIPPEYYTIRDVLPAQTLYLPKGIYLTYNWSLKAGMDGRIANPISKESFPKILVIPNELDFGSNPSIYPASNCTTTSCLLQNNFSYVILDKCVLIKPNIDWVKQNAEIYKEGDCLTVYKLT